MDPDRIEEAITSRTRAILCVHQLGMPCDLAAIVAIARQHRLPVVEDAACALGSEIFWEGRWERIGKPHGDIACFSFHPRKILTMGDGGMVTTSRPDWADRISRLRQHGMSVPAHVRHAAPAVTTEEYEELGFNYRLTDIQAAIGSVQLRRLPELVAARRRLAARYASLLAAVPDLVPPAEPAWARSNWQAYAVRLPHDVDQQGVMERMLERGVATRLAVVCAHREPAFPRETWSCGATARSGACEGPACRHLRHSEAARDGAIQIPLFPSLTDAEQSRVVAALIEAIARSRAKAS
jgi:dTDP-4-amino-4,6-dideoxygalactose transaminase